MWHDDELIIPNIAVPTTHRPVGHRGQAGLLGAIAVIVGGFLIVISLREPGQGGWAFVGALLVLAGVYLWIAGFHAGIGVARDGVLVRSIYGRTHWIPWSEIEQFEIVRPPNWSGGVRAIAVVLHGRSPLIADACAYTPWAKWSESNKKILQDLLRALEDERIAAQRSLNGAADQDLWHP